MAVKARKYFVLYGTKGVAFYARSKAEKSARVDFVCFWSLYDGLFNINQNLLDAVYHDCNSTNKQIDTLVPIFTHNQLQNYFM
jgi:hypothetical protein